MRLYDFATAPSPQRVNMFLKEKNVEVEKFKIDMGTGAQLGEEYRAINPRCTLPALILDDGTVLSEVVAIFRYIESEYPEPSLLGISAKQQALICEWDHRIEIELISAIADTLRNGSKAFKDRALPGALNVSQIPELVERGQLRIGAFLQILDQQLADNEYIAGENFSAADITGYIAVDFCSWVKISIPNELTNLQAWYEKIGARYSVKAKR